MTIDLGSSDGPVIYFDHEWPGHQGRVLAPESIEFAVSEIRLGAVGEHDCFAFVCAEGLDASSPAARQWQAVRLLNEKLLLRPSRRPLRRAGPFCSDAALNTPVHCV